MNTNERENQQLFVSWEIGSSSYFLKGTNAVVLQCINQGTTFFAYLGRLFLLINSSSQEKKGT